jgi:hypothetical protein
MDRTAYHLAELQIALDPRHPRHLNPPPIPAGYPVPDIGCGAGQTLKALDPQLTGHLFAFPGPYESFQPRSGMRRAPARAGFTTIHIDRNERLVITASR